MTADGSGRQNLSSEMEGFLVNISPDEKWAATWGQDHGVVLLPLAGGPPRPLCYCGAGPIFHDSPRVSWSGDGKALFVNGGGSMAGIGTTMVPWHGVETLPPGAAMSLAELRQLPGARQIGETSIAPGQTGARFAFTRQAEQSNLYRIRVP